MAFQPGAFQPDAFQMEHPSGGGVSDHEFNNEAFAQVYLRIQKAADQVKAPEPVVGVIRDIAEEEIKSPKPMAKKERGSALRSRIRSLDYEVNTIYQELLNALIDEYKRTAELLEKQRRRDDDDLAVMLLLM